MLLIFCIEFVVGGIFDGVWGGRWGMVNVGGVDWYWVIGGIEWRWEGVRV